MNKRSNTLLVAALALGFFVAAPGSHAQAKGKAKKAKPTKVKPTKVKAEKTADGAAKPAKNFDFMADEIDGSRVRPDGTSIFGIEGVKHTSLIRLREHFINEIIRTADML